jgi:hypothetical protein
MSKECSTGAKKAKKIYKKINGMKSATKKRAALKKFFKKLEAWNKKNKCPFAKKIAALKKKALAKKNSTKSGNKTHKKNHTKKNKTKKLVGKNGSGVRKNATKKNNTKKPSKKQTCKSLEKAIVAEGVKLVKAKKLTYKAYLALAKKQAKAYKKAGCKGAAAQTKKGYAEAKKFFAKQMAKKLYEEGTDLRVCRKYTIRYYSYATRSYRYRTVMKCS